MTACISRAAKSKAFWASTAVMIMVATGAMAQLQQSGGGGSAVTLQPGSAVAGKFGIDQTTPGTTNGVQINAALPAGSNVIGHVIADSGSTTTVTQSTGSNLHTVIDSGTVTGITNALPTGSNVIGTVNTIPKTACGNTVASVQLGAVPTTSTLATSASTTCVVAIVMNNTTASALTATVTDNTGTPINDVLTFSIPANSQLIQPLYGISFNAGVKWSASGSGVTGGMIGYQ